MGPLSRSLVQIGISAVLALGLGVLAAFIAFRWFERDVTDLDITLESDAPVIQADPALRGRMMVTFDGTEVSQLRVVTVRVRNAGNTEIEPGDFAAPITFGLDEGQFLSGEVVGRSPQEVDMDIASLDPASVELADTLLNAGDEITLALVTTSDSEGALGVQARVSGVPRVRLESRQVDAGADGRTGLVQTLMSLAAGIATAVAVGGTIPLLLTRWKRGLW